MTVASKTSLWKAAFTSKARDFKVERARLETALLTMRDNVGKLVGQIPADCKDLTDHSLTHLDALWELASLLIDKTFPLNPAEAFVLGGAILLHDAALSTAAFPRGLEEIKNTPEWRNAATSLLLQNDFEANAEHIQNPPAELISAIKFAARRCFMWVACPAPLRR